MRGWLGFLAVSAVLLWPFHVAQPAQAGQPAPAFPVMSLSSSKLSGAAAVSALGANLASVAAFYGKTAEQLRQQLLTDSTLHVSASGRLFFIDPALPLPVRPGKSAARLPRAEAAPFPLDQTFELHSKPGADKTIMLQFRGATVENTVWNSGLQVPRFVAPPFDLEGNPAVFSESELAVIQQTWQRVAEDFMPFDVDVTTAAVPQERLTRDFHEDKVYGTVALVTPYVFACPCAGISILGNFYDNETYKPSFIFYNADPAQAWFFDAKYFEAVISHEVGHAIGLSHDGSSSGEYYGGHGSSPVNGWAPIMGLNDVKPLAQFSKGEYADANNHEDDFALIQSRGLPLRADDAGNTIQDALWLPVSTSARRSNGAFEGVITSAADRDVFAISAGTGMLTANVDPSAYGPNADLSLTLVDANGKVVEVSDPQNNLSASISQQINEPGTYYLEVKGTGEGDPLQTGYTNYGSVGAFRLAASYPLKPSARPVAAFTPSAASGPAPLEVTFDPSASSDDVQIIDYNWSFSDGTGERHDTPQRVTRTFGTGTHTATLVVTDDSGQVTSTSHTITVSPPIVSVAKMDLKISGRAWIKGAARLWVVDKQGRPVKGAVVSANWSGFVTASQSQRTARNGTAVMRSTAKPGKGCFRLTVSSIVVGSTTYPPAGVTSAQACR